MSDFEISQGISLNGADLTVFASQLAIEIVAALSATPKEADEKLGDIAGRFMDIRRNVRDPRMGVLFGALAERLSRSEGAAG